MKSKKNYFKSFLGIVFVTMLFGVLFSAKAEASIFSKRITSSYDDAEESDNQNIFLTNTKLQLVNDPTYERGDQNVGLRFQGVNIPKDATITGAHFEFRASESDSGTTNLIITAQDSDNPGTFADSSSNISGRAAISTQVTWSNVESWVYNNTYQSADISSIVQDLVNRSGWVEGNSMVFT